MSQTGNKAGGTGFPLRFNQQQNASKDTFSLRAGKGSGAKFIAHVLGLDSEHEAAGKGRLAASSAGGTAGQKALSGMKLSDLFAGFKPTPNFLFLLLFLGFFLWIFVIYWVRHNEPFANQVLGSPKADPHKAAADRRIVAGIKNAFPVQTSASTGEIYVPGIPSQTQPQAHLEQASPQASPAMPANPALAIGAYVPDAAAAPSGLSLGAATAIHARPVILAPYGTPYPAQTSPVPTTYPAYGQAEQMHVMPPVHVGQGNYLVGVQSNSGTRVKTIVSR